MSHPNKMILITCLILSVTIINPHKSEFKNQDYINCMQKYSLPVTWNTQTQKSPQSNQKQHIYRKFNQKIESYLKKKNPGYNDQLKIPEKNKLIMKHLTLPSKQLFRENNQKHRFKTIYKKYHRPIQDIQIIHPSIPVAFLRRSLMFRLPDQNKYYLKPGWKEFNMNVETAIEMNTTGLLIAQYEQFSLVATSLYTGWVPNVNIAKLTRENLNWIRNSRFLLVTVPFFYDYRMGIINMGTHMILIEEKPDHFLIALPKKDVKGHFSYSTVRFNKIFYSNYFSKRYLTFSHANLLSLIKKYAGFHYGWGDDFGGVDCSSLVRNIYRVFGLSLPRNSNDQRLKSVFPEKYIDMNSMNDTEKLRIIKTLEIGDLLFRNNHVMIYTGDQSKQNNSFIPGIFHAFTYCYMPDHLKMKRISNFKVIHTSLDLPYKTGNIYLRELNGAIKMVK